MNDSIRELMDSCPPQGDGLGQPEMRPLVDLIAADAGVARQLDRSRRLDVGISRAVQDVPIPAGLEQRLLAALGEHPGVSPQEPSKPLGDASGSASGLDLESRPSAAAADLDLVTPGGKPALGSWRLWATLATCAAALALIPLLVNRQPVGEVGYEELVSSALNWELSDEAWLSDHAIWTRYPLPKQMTVMRLDGRQEVQLSQFKLTAYCYAVALQSGSARIFVFDKPLGFTLPTAPPVQPMFTQGRCVAAWTSDGLVYVLVLDGGENDYKRAIQNPRQISFWAPAVRTSFPIGTV